MATLREYFFTEFSTGLAHFDYPVRPASGGPIVDAIARVHFDFASFTRYVSYFIPEGQYSHKIAAYLTQYPSPVLDKANEVQMTSSHPAVYDSSMASDELPFSGRVFLYVDQVIPDKDTAGLIEAARNFNIHLQIRDRRYSDFLALHEKPWAFISHDSRDKESFVTPLASKLRSMMCPVWYDEYSLRVGQSLRESIDKGLRESPKCILVMSPNFLSNPGWTKGEFNAAMNKHFSQGASVVLPIWLNVSRPEVAEYSPLVADIVALKSDMGIDELARRLFVEINPTGPGK